MLIVVCAEIHEFHLFFVCFHLIDRVRMPQVWWLLSAICSVSLAPKHSTIWRCGCRYPSLYFSMGSSVYLGEHFFLVFVFSHNFAFDFTFTFFECFSFVATYFSLPETEDRSLEDIELYFANKNRKWTDLHIPINSNRQLAANKGDV